MDCHDVRALADAYLDDELLVETNHAVLAHLGNCVACSEEVQKRRTLRVRFKRAFDSNAALAPREDLVASLRSHLDTSAGKPGGTTWRRYIPWMGVAATVVVVFITLWHGQRGRSARMADDPAVRPLIDSAVGDHRDCALRHQPSEPPVPLDQAAADDTALRDLDAAVRSSTTGLAPPPAMLGAHACVWKGRRFGHIVLSFKDAVVSVLVTRAETDTSQYAMAAPTECSDAAELSVVCFAAPRHAVFVVSDLPSKESLALAQPLAPTLRTHLSRPSASLETPEGVLQHARANVCGSIEQASGGAATRRCR
ncbi:MAG: zf-HC2 domain-containing protein [Acidobacteria bacterium]|nr:zf-HC2 domain-containing protein [Acidobacteriota bacterium]